VSVTQESRAVSSMQPTRRAWPPVQIGGFLRKETASVFRQPRLLLVLVAGPFLILLLFAVGYDEQQSVLRTAFVGPEGSIYERSIDQFADDLEQYVINAGYSDDLVAAERQLRNGDIDAVVVFPADPLESVLNGEQADITVLHDKIDPIQQVAVDVSSQVAVMELNARVLEEIVGRAQETLVPVNDSLTTAETVTDELLAAIENDDEEAAQEALTDWMRRPHRSRRSDRHRRNSPGCSAPTMRRSTRSPSSDSRPPIFAQPSISPRAEVRSRSTTRRCSASGSTR
jgi:ABC-2 type transport system permease protein